MPELVFKVPPELANAMSQLMGQMKKLSDVTDQVAQIQQQASASLQLRAQITTQLQHSPLGQITSLMRPLPHIFNRFDSVLSRNVDKMLWSLGPSARSYIRTLVIPSELFSQVESVLRIAGLVRLGAVFAGPIGVAASFGFAAKWIYERSIGLIQNVVRDSRQALQFGTTFGGVQAVELGLSGLPMDPGLLNQVALARLNVFTRQAGIIYGMLGVRRHLDTVQDYVELIQNMQAFIRAQAGPGRLALAIKYFLTEQGLQISPELQAAIMTAQTPEEVRQWAEKILRAQKLGDLPVKDQIKIDDIVVMWQNLAILIHNRFFHLFVQSGLAVELTKLAKWMTDYVVRHTPDQPTSEVQKPPVSPASPKQKHMKSGATSEVQKLAENIQEFNQRMEQYAAGFMRTASQLSFISTAEAKAIPGGGIVPRGVGGIPPMGGLPVTPSPAPPSRALPHWKVMPRGVPVAPGKRRIAPPIAPTQAPVTTAAPGRGRTRALPGIFHGAREVVPAGGPAHWQARPGAIPAPRPSNSLAADRAKYAAELEANPALKEKVFLMARNEQGSNPLGVQMIIESMMNRASVRHTTLAQQARSTREGGYYSGAPTTGHVSAKDRPIYEQALRNALGGSNDANYATENASGGLAARRSQQQGGYLATQNGEFFFRPPNDQQGNIKSWQTWRGQVAQQTDGQRIEYPSLRRTEAGEGGTDFYDPVSGTRGGGVIGTGMLPRSRGGHQGLDILAPSGSPIYAVGSGVIEHQGTDNWGTQVTIIRLDDGRRAVYMHHHLNSNLTPGTRVEAGQPIGTSGQANNVQHLHFEMWEGQRLHSRNITMEYFTGQRRIVGGQPIHGHAAQLDPQLLSPHPLSPVEHHFGEIDPQHDDQSTEHPSHSQHSLRYHLNRREDHSMLEPLPRLDNRSSKTIHWDVQTTEFA